MASSLANKNRRLNQRQKPKRLVKVICHRGVNDLGPNLTVSVLDVSETGIRMIVAAPFDAGQDVTLRLEGLGHLRPLKIEATVVWSVLTTEGQYCVGLRFRKCLAYTDLVRMT